MEAQKRRLGNSGMEVSPLGFGCGPSRPVHDVWDVRRLGEVDDL
jgi:hypothetical protein